MRPEAPSPGSPADWLRHARSDLALTRGPHDPEVLLETLASTPNRQRRRQPRRFW
jgi:hypothetical protein